MGTGITPFGPQLEIAFLLPLFIYDALRYGLGTGADELPIEDFELMLSLRSVSKSLPAPLLSTQQDQLEIAI